MVNITLLIKENVKNKKKKFIMFAVLLLMLFCFYIFYMNHKKKSEAENFPAVSVTRGNIVEKVTAIGNITPLQKTAVKSPISGRVSKLFHDEGDYVMQNQPLLEIQPDPTPQEYIKAKQTFEIDLAKERQSRLDVERYKKLLSEKAISPKDQDYSRAISEYNQNHNQRILDEEILSLLEKGKATLGNKTIANIIRSPITGYILARNINLGDSVSAQTTAQPGSVLFTIANMNNLIFKGQISEIDITKLHINAPATLKIAALPDVILTGVLTKIGLQSTSAAKADSDSSNPMTGAGGSDSQSNNLPFAVGFNVEISQLNDAEKKLNLRAGYSANAEIVVNQVKNTLLIPMRVLHFENEKPYVFIIDKKEKFKKLLIKIGLSDGMQVQVLEGLSEGQKIASKKPDSNSGADAGQEDDD